MTPKKPAPGWIYGINPLREAIGCGRRIERIYVIRAIGEHNHRIQEIIVHASARGIPVEETGREFFDRFGNAVHQGVCATVERLHAAGIEELFHTAVRRKDPPLFLILDGIEDPRNFGALLRVAEGAGSSGVIFQSRHSAGITPLVEKASSGAAELVPLCVVSNIKHAIGFLKKKGVFVYGAKPGSGHSLWETDLAGPAAFVLGSEGKGLKETVQRLCDILLELPLFGQVASLNVSVAAGIFLFEWRRQAAKGTGGCGKPPLPV